MKSVDLMSLWKFVCLFICVNLWEIECTLAMRWDACNSLRSSFSHEGLFFLSQNSQILQSIIAHSFELTREWPLPQPLPYREGRDMWGYPYKTAIKGHNEAYILFIGVSRWLLPFPSGEGPGEGPLFFWPLCVLFFCVNLWEKTHQDTPTRLLIKDNAKPISTL